MSCLSFRRAPVKSWRRPARPLPDDPRLRQIRQAPALPPPPELELPVVAAPLLEHAGVLLVGVGLGGAQAPAHLHRPRLPEAARLRQADRERVLVPGGGGVIVSCEVTR